MGGSGNLPVGPGIWGFIAFFVLAVALWFLVRNMNSRLRRMAYRDRDEQQAADATSADADAVNPPGRVDPEGRDGRIQGPPIDDTADHPGPDGEGPRP